MTKRDRRTRSSSVSSSNSDSDASSDNAHSRHRTDEHKSRHKKKEKKAHSKKKKDKKRKKESSSSSRRDRDKKKSRHDNSEDDVIRSSRKAHAAVDDLLHEFPELRSDLVTLLRMLHGGGIAVISGIENRRIRSQLKALFPLLGLKKLSEPKGAFAQREAKKPRAGASTLLEGVLRELETTNSAPAPITAAADNSDGRSRTSAGVSPSAAAAGGPAAASVESAVAAGEAKRQAPIGPAMPPGGIPSATAAAGTNDAAGYGDDDDDDDDVVGPALPGMKGFRAADERVEAEMARRALELKQTEWDRARGVAPSDAEAKKSKTAPLARQEWMTVMPESSFFKDSLAPANRPPGKAAAFRTKEPAAVDLSWFDAPEERERARRAKLDIELLGYIREENAPTAASAASRAAAHAAASDSVGSAHESIVPAANPVADEKMRQQMEQLRASRGPSLLEQHQQHLADEAKRTGGAKSKAKGGWDRDRDLTARRGMSNDDASKIIEASRSINSKFTAPTITRQFL